MTGADRKTAGGFSLFELVVVIVLVGILLVVALWKMSGFIREAERVSVLTLEGEMRNTLVMEMAKRILNPDGPRVLQLESSNPMDLMLETPNNYLGNLDRLLAQDVPGRHWFFEVDARHLVYRPGGQFSNDSQELGDIHYFVRVVYTDLDDDGDFNAGNDRLLGVRLQRHGGERWLSRQDTQK